MISFLKLKTTYIYTVISRMLSLFIFYSYLFRNVLETVIKKNN